MICNSNIFYITMSQNILFWFVTNLLCKEDVRAILSSGGILWDIIKSVSNHEIWQIHALASVIEALISSLYAYVYSGGKCCQRVMICQGTNQRSRGIYCGHTQAMMTWQYGGIRTTFVANGGYKPSQRHKREQTIFRNSLLNIRKLNDLIMYSRFCNSLASICYQWFDSIYSGSYIMRQGKSY